MSNPMIIAVTEKGERKMRDRLTTRLANGGVGYDNGEYFKVCYPWNEHCLSDVDRMAIKLCDLEDKIEQGEIVELPCKVGQTIYALWSGGRKGIGVAEFKVISINLDCPDDMEIVYRSKKLNATMCRYANASDIGKTLFLTREEAEKSLKESKR